MCLFLSPVITGDCDTHPLREHSTDLHPCCALEVAQGRIFRLCLLCGWLCQARLAPWCLEAMLAMLRQLSTLTHDVSMFP